VAAGSARKSAFPLNSGLAAQVGRALKLRPSLLLSLRSNTA